jgi:hypothetical protein
MHDDQGANHALFPMKGQNIKVNLFPPKVEKVSALKIGVHGVGHKFRCHGKVIGQWRSGGNQFVLHVIYRHPSKPFPVSKFLKDFLQTPWMVFSQ